ncbi:MAG: leucine-rich repeat protein, partial [Abditibacteriota bacterium]|nr:leucine-rich repeat protein [Abditibacteriota bacterium]
MKNNDKLFETETRVILKKYNGKENEVVIPDGVNEIGEYAFGWYSPLREITIPDSVEFIGAKA